jgi:hypothetical protein
MSPAADWADIEPGEAGADSEGAEDELEPEDRTLPVAVRNGDLSADQQDPTAVGPTSDPHPDDTDADFPGGPLTDAEIDALPDDDLG